jgi:hypothetical protein
MFSRAWEKKGCVMCIFLVQVAVKVIHSYRKINSCFTISVADAGCLSPGSIFSIPDLGTRIQCKKYSRSRIRIRIKEFKYF